MLLLALVFYLHYEAPPDEQNFPMVMEMIRAGEVREDNDEFQSPLADWKQLWGRSRRMCRSNGRTTRSKKMRQSMTLSRISSRPSGD